MLALKEGRDATAGLDGGHLTVAIGYDGQEEIAGAVRSLLDFEGRAGADIADLAERLTAEDIAAHLYTSGMPDPDLIIRTSGERAVPRRAGFASACRSCATAYEPGATIAVALGLNFFR